MFRKVRETTEIKDFPTPGSTYQIGIGQHSDGKICYFTCWGDKYPYVCDLPDENTLDLDNGNGVQFFDTLEETEKAMDLALLQNRVGDKITWA